MCMNRPTFVRSSILMALFCCILYFNRQGSGDGDTGEK